MHICYGSWLAFLVKLKSIKITFLYVVLEIRQFCLSSCFQTFKKKQWEANIWDATIIPKSFTCILVICYFLWKIRYCNCMKNLQITVICELQNWSVEHKQRLWNFAETVRRTNIWGGTNILVTSRYLFLGYVSGKWNTFLLQYLSK